MTGLTRKQAAALVGVSEHTIVGWRSRGYLQPSLPGRPQRYTVEEVLAAQQVAHVGDVVPRWRANPVHAGQRLRALRERAGLNQQQLARQAGLTHEEISRLEGGDKSPKAPALRKLGQALAIAPALLVSSEPIGLELLSTEDAGHRLDVPTARVGVWLRQGVLPGVKVGGQWRVPAIAVAELERSNWLRGASRRLDPRFRG
jgi:transcriptional regulator with XRE-family HTH domain